MGIAVAGDKGIDKVKTLGKGAKAAGAVEDVESVEKTVKAAETVKGVADAGKVTEVTETVDDVVSAGEKALEGSTESIKYSPINPCDEISQEIAETFRGATFTKTTLAEDTTFYRVYSSEENQIGRYFTRTPQNGGMQSQMDLALNPDWGNSATYVDEIIIPKGTTIYEGVAAPQSINSGAGILSGGGNQVFIPKIEAGWFK